MVWLYTILSVLAISLISLIGVFAISIKEKALNRILSFLVSFAAGALLGGAFIHLIPEHVEEFGGFGPIAVAGVLGGILVFFAIEKLLKWHHCHSLGECEKRKHASFTTMNLVGDAFHNFIDGIIIAVSYLASIPLGVATTIAVALHEIPQEIGDFGVLVHGGFSRKKALKFNLLSALTAIVGAVFVLLIGKEIQGLTDFLIPFTAGGFIYIGASDLIPEMHKETKLSKSLIQIIGIVLGIGIMYSLTLIGHHH